MNLFFAPLRPLADVLDLTAEALAALGTVSVIVLSDTLDRSSDDRSGPRLTLVEAHRLR